jgi:hypothetical protein
VKIRLWLATVTALVAAGAAVAAGTIDAGASAASGRVAAANSAGLRVTAPPAQLSTLGKQAGLQVRATTGAGRLAFTAAGLPDGLSISKSTGKISGIPAVTAGIWRPKVTVSAAGKSAAVSFRWAVRSALGPVNDYDGKCVNDYAGSAKNGTKLVIWTCDGQAAQRIVFAADGELQVNGKCVTGSLKTTLEPCKDTSSQIWKRTSSREYVLAADRRCLTDPGGSTVNGTQLNLENCMTTGDQQWSVPTPPAPKPKPTPKPTPTPTPTPSPTSTPNPLIPTEETTSPESSQYPGGPLDYGCGSAVSDLPWLGSTGVYLNAHVVPASAGDTVQAEYSMWDNGTAISDPTYPSATLTEPGSVSTLVNFPLADGHEYTWTVAAYSAPNGATGPTYLSPDAEKCGFKVDSTAPNTPTVTSSAFPRSNRAQTATTGTFAFTSSDPAPACGGCEASGVYEFEYSLNQQLPVGYVTPGCGTPATYMAVLATTANGVATATSCPLSVSLWGTNTLYVEAIDKAGNVSRTSEYSFYIPSS